MVKDWVTYIDEFDKVQAWDVTRMTVPQIKEVQSTIEEVGFNIIGKVAFTHKASAIDYTKFLISRRPACRKHGNQHSVR